jgi:glycine/D-amino acid oxidase-like deaminating enzyme
VKVIVLGSGVIGVTTAYYLARAGHEVTVVDRQAEPAQETSFANAGEVSPGYSSPWAGPGVPVKAIKWLLMRHGPLVIWPKLDPVMWWWMLKMLRNCTAERYAINKSRMIPIAEYSQVRRAQSGHAAALSQAEATRRHGRGYRGAQADWRAVRSTRSRRLHRRGAGACHGEGEVRRRTSAAAG